MIKGLVMLRRTGIEYSGICLIGAGAAQISFWLSTALVILIITGRVITFFNWVIPMWRSAQIVNVLAVVLTLIGLIGVYKFIRTKPSALDPLGFLFAFIGTLLLLAQRVILLLNTHAPFFLSPHDEQHPKHRCFSGRISRPLDLRADYSPELFR